MKRIKYKAKRTHQTYFSESARPEPKSSGKRPSETLVNAVMQHYECSREQAIEKINEFEPKERVERSKANFQQKAEVVHTYTVHHNHEPVSNNWTSEGGSNGRGDTWTCAPGTHGCCCPCVGPNIPGPSGLS